MAEVGMSGPAVGNELASLPDSGEEAPAGRYARNGQPREILVDPEVSRRKFQRELDGYSRIAADQRRLGWWVLHAEYPEVLVAFMAAQLRPAAVVLAAVLDFTNFDLWAPSVTLVDPFTMAPLRYRDVPEPQRLIRMNEEIVQVPGVGQLPGHVARPLLVAHGPDEVPFVCLPGVREYHEHPGHSGDSWLLHRGRGEGTLFFLMENLYRYGVQPIRGYQLGLHIVGFSRAEPVA